MEACSSIAPFVRDTKTGLYLPSAVYVVTGERIAAAELSSPASTSPSEDVIRFVACVLDAAVVTTEPIMSPGMTISLKQQQQHQYLQQQQQQQPVTQSDDESFEPSIQEQLQQAQQLMNPYSQQQSTTRLCKYLQVWLWYQMGNMRMAFQRLQSLVSCSFGTGYPENLKDQETNGEAAPNSMLSLSLRAAMQFSLAFMAMRDKKCVAAIEYYAAPLEDTEDESNDTLPLEIVFNVSVLLAHIGRSQDALTFLRDVPTLLDFCHVSPSACLKTHSTASKNEYADDNRVLESLRILLGLLMLRTNDDINNASNLFLRLMARRSRTLAPAITMDSPLMEELVTLHGAVECLWRTGRHISKVYALAVTAWSVTAQGYLLHPHRTSVPSEVGVLMVGAGLLAEVAARQCQAALYLGMDTTAVADAIDRADAFLEMAMSPPEGFSSSLTLFPRVVVSSGQRPCENYFLGLCQWSLDRAKFRIQCVRMFLLMRGMMTACVSSPADEKSGSSKVARHLATLCSFRQPGKKSLDDGGGHGDDFGTEVKAVTEYFFTLLKWVRMPTSATVTASSFALAWLRKRGYKVDTLLQDIEKAKATGEDNIVTPHRSWEPLSRLSALFEDDCLLLDNMILSRLIHETMCAG